MGFLGDAWDWATTAAGDAWDGVTGAVDDTLSQEQVNGYEPNQDNFQLGGSATYAADRANALSTAGTQRGGQMAAAGAQRNAALRSEGQTALGTAENRANQFNQAGAQGSARQHALALGYGSTGSSAMGQAGSRAITQGNQGVAIQADANRTANALGNRSTAAMSRPDVAVQNQSQNMVNRSLETQSRESQLQAAQALGMRANDNSGMQNTQGLRNFAGQTGSGPSVAQSQMQAGSENSMASALALARSGRGNNTGAVRQAAFQNAATQQQTNQQLGTLRAQEFDQAQGRQLSALGAESQALQGYRGQDLQALQGAAGVLGQSRGLDQAQQQIGIGQGQFDATMGLQNRQLNDATALGFSGQQLQSQARGDAALFQGQQLGNQSITQGQQFNLGMQGLGQQALQSGQQFELGKNQLASQSIQSGQAYNAQLQGLGNQYDLGMQGMGNQYDLGMQGLSNQTQATQLQANMGYEGMRSGNSMATQQANAAADQARDASTMGTISSAAGAMMMMSDERGKTDIKRRNAGMSLIEAGGYGAQFRAGQAMGGLLGDLGDPDGSDAASGMAAGRGAYDASFAASAGGDPYGLSGKPSFTVPKYEPPQAPERPEEEGGGMMAMASSMISDEHSKREIQRLQAELGAAYKALGGPAPAHASFDRDALDDAHQRDATAPSIDLRPAQGYSYRYKDPSAQGAAPGQQFGPMAQDLEKSPATRGAVFEGPDGMKRVDPGRLTMVNTAALSEQQREIQAIKEALAQNNSRPPSHASFDRDALDEAYRRSTRGN